MLPHHGGRAARLRICPASFSAARVRLCLPDRAGMTRRSGPGLELIGRRVAPGRGQGQGGAATARWPPRRRSTPTSARRPRPGATRHRQRPAPRRRGGPRQQVVPRPANGPCQSVARKGRMAGNVYITALQPGSGKSAVVLGLTEVLARQAGRLAFYRPFIASAEPPDPDIELIRSRFRLPQSYLESPRPHQPGHPLRGGPLPRRAGEAHPRRLRDRRERRGRRRCRRQRLHRGLPRLGAGADPRSGQPPGVPRTARRRAERARPSRCSMRCVRISAFWSSAAAPCSG